MVPLLDGNSYAVIVSKVVEEEMMILNEAKYKVGMGTWLKKYNVKSDDDNWPFVD